MVYTSPPGGLYYEISIWLKGNRLKGVDTFSYLKSESLDAEIHY